MDANAADELLVQISQREVFRADYVRARDEAARGLIAAAENVTYGESELVPIEALQIGLGEYESAIQHALDLHDHNDAGALDGYAKSRAHRRRQAGSRCRRPG